MKQSFHPYRAPATKAKKKIDQGVYKKENIYVNVPLSS